MVRVFIALLVVTLFSGSAFSASKMHVLFAMDTDADTIGSDVETDSQNLIQVFGEIREGREEKLDWNQYSGPQLTPANLRGFYQGRNWDPDTTLIFIYSGHGGMDSGGQFLAMKHGAIYREEIRKLLEETGTIGQVIITDACANLVADGLVEKIPQRRVPAEWAMFEQLFLQTEGLVDINATKEGFFSFTTRLTGGFFLYTFTRLLCEPIESVDYNKDGRVTWNEFGGNLAFQTKALFKLFQDVSPENSGIRRQETQEPQFYYLAGSARDEEMKKRINANLNQLYGAEAEAVQKYAVFTSTIGHARTAAYANYVASRYEAFGKYYDGIARLYENESKGNVVPYSKRHATRNGNRAFANQAQTILLGKIGSLLQSRNTQYELARGYRTLASRLP